MRIAQVAPIAGPVAPDNGRSIEQMVCLLTDELVRRGHEVTLFATGDSQTSAELRALYPRGYDYTDDFWDWQFHETLHMASVFEHADEFDVIHSHAYHFALPFTRLVRTPVVHTYHILPDEDVVRAYGRYPEGYLVAISQYQRSKLQGICKAEVIYHGIKAEAFPFRGRRGDYLLFLGRLIPDKGPGEAIQLARRTGMRLVIAGPREEGDYFSAEIEPLIDGRIVQYVGPVSTRERNELLAGAAALLYSVIVSEPFGLVMVEAAACGTPVAALARGAVPEIVTNGVTGYCAPDLDSLERCLPATLELDRARVRREAMARFDYRRMTDDYVALYERLVERRWALTA